MKIFIGLILVLLGLFLLGYIGIYLMFIGGIIQIIEAIKSTPIESYGIAIGITKILLANLVGWMSAILPMGVGMRLIKKN